MKKNDNHIIYLSDEEEMSEMYTLDTLPKFSLDPIDLYENIYQYNYGINYEKDKDIMKFYFNTMEENNERFYLDLSVSPSFEDYTHITRILEQRSNKITNIHKESDSGSVVDEYISQLFDETLIFFSDPKSLDYAIRENELTSSEVHLPTYFTVCKDSAFEIERDEIMPNDFYLVT